MKEDRYWIWFQLVFGPGSRRSQQMMDRFESPREIYEAAVDRGTAREAMTPAELAAAAPAMEQAALTEKRTRDKGVDILTPDSPLYPGLLHNIYAKPAVLYVRGDISCLRDCVCIAMVGARECTGYGRKAAGELAADLCRSGVVIVSGLAHGIDSAAHQGALRVGGSTVGLLACGMDVDYPRGAFPLKKEICKNGAVVTEFPLGAAPKPYMFHMRNRIISGVSRGVVVVEAARKSGSMVTVSHAKDQNREVFAVPGDIFSAVQEGPHHLIQDGAKLVTCAGDILAEYGICPEARESRNAPAAMAQPDKSPPRLPTGGGAQAVYALLNTKPQGVEQLASLSALPVGELQGALTELELEGLAQSLPGRRFVKK